MCTINAQLSRIYSKFKALLPYTYEIFFFWYLVLFKERTYERAKYIDSKYTLYSYSGLFYFLATVVFCLTIPIIFIEQYPFLQISAILILPAGLQLPLFMSAGKSIRNYVWQCEDVQRELELEKIREQMKEQRQAREEQQRKEWEEFLESVRRAAEQKRKASENKQRREYESTRESQRNNEESTISYNLNILGLPAKCRDRSLIKKAYRTIIKNNHPDISKSKNASKITQDAIKAYDYLIKSI